MTRAKEWMKEKQNRELLIKLLVVAVFPLLMCIVYCLREGAWIGQLHLPSAQNNDILFYHMQVAGAVEHGYPLGYFGFNESSAGNMSFASWSPVILIPWILWGKLFGWNEFSPFICNIVLFTVVAMLVVCWLRPTYKQLMVTGAMLIIFPAFSRYLMSCLGEAVFLCLVLLFYGLALAYAKEEKMSRLVGLFVVASLLTWMRPYYVLLVCLPGTFLILKNRRIGIPLSIGLGIVDLAAYFLVQKNFTAAYFTELYNWSIITAFKDYGFMVGLYNLKNHAVHMVVELITAIKGSLQEGLFLGSNYCVFFVVVFLVFTLLVSRNRKKDAKLSVVYFHYIVTSILCLGALLLLMQKVNETSRHMMSFVLAGMLLIGCTTEIKRSTLWKPALVVLSCVYLYHVFPDDGKDYQVPIQQEGREEEALVWEEIFDKIELNEDGQPSFENTMIWTFSDEMDGQVVYMSWHHMLQAPAGIGISCCDMGYLENNWENLNSRYITVLAGGKMDQKCNESGYEVVGQTEDKILYKRY